ncbi:hypothetical protein [Streptomyces niveus]|uniref:hypothetical protein n=1 Tax=Streptomyces niveus TaxID=193462 RepID=UPI0038685762
MTIQQPDPEERRIAQALRRLGVGPDAQVPAVPPRPRHAPPAPTTPGEDWVDHALAQTRAARTPINPTRIIPAGAPLPGRGPDNGGAPPRQPAVAPPLPPNGWYGPGPYQAQPPAAPIEVRVTVDLNPAPEPEPTWREQLTAWLRTYASPHQAILGLLLAVAPIPVVGHSTAAIWYTTVAQARDAGSGWGYALGGTALALTCVTLTRRRALTGGRANNFLRMWAFAVTLVGATGAVSPYDPVTWITGVTP